MPIRPPSCFVLLLFLACSACTHLNPHYDANKAHHRVDGFSNNYLPPINVPFSDIVRWYRESKGKPAAPSQFVQGYHFPLVKTDTAFLRSNRTQTTYTWIGHASGLVQMGGINLLTDPIFSERASPFSWLGPKRKTPLPFPLSELPHIEVVVISHNHYDHLDLPTLKALSKQPGGSPLFLVPLGMQSWMKAQGLANSLELDWWQQTELNDVKLTFVPAQHWSARGLGDRNRVLWGGWVAQAPNFSFYYSGDTGYSADFADIGSRFGGFDLATIPVGVYEPRWFIKNQHVNPEEAVQIHRDVKARQSIGVHWGTFELSDEPLDQVMGDLPAARARLGVADEAFLLLRHGETRIFAGHERPSP
ncbi:MBL fold metallo-hydrolase [Pseudomethylobacillus aquaticus]|uniref:MBL fold metallo-hydrolase n=1 Tax=Pseudomethylobacillus aquaticus TaxID=2676064 RepID=A0A3N0V3G0_9PROT|nr:MBL fold metallo-hydrolase [Pseudomethylobacillus aquaticus]